MISSSPLKGLFAFIFKLIAIAIILGASFGMVGIGWIYAFGDCEGRFSKEIINRIHLILIPKL